jgi:hypothetical protein
MEHVAECIRQERTIKLWMHFRAARAARDAISPRTRLLQNSYKSPAKMGQVDSAEAHLQKLMSFLLERSQRICSRGLASSNLQHRKSRRVECEEAKPAGAQELAARARSSRRNPSLLRLSGRGRRTCWIMQTALGEHAGSCKLRGGNMPEVRAPSPSPS